MFYPLIKRLVHYPSAVLLFLGLSGGAMLFPAVAQDTMKGETEERAGAMNDAGTLEKQERPDPSEPYGVSGLASDERLEVREEPFPSAPVIATFATDATTIIVSGTTFPDFDKQGVEWWEVLLGPDQTGWVDGRYLYRLHTSIDSMIDYPLSCHGTEPFWGVQVRQEKAVFWFSDPVEKVIWQAGPAIKVWGDLPGAAIHFEATGNSGGQVKNGMLFALALDTACSNGMADHEFPFHALLATPSGDALDGCCERRL